jgi:hypothetical protein
MKGRALCIHQDKDPNIERQISFFSIARFGNRVKQASSEILIAKVNKDYGTDPQ